MTQTSMQQIERQALRLSKSRARLANHKAALEADIDSAKSKHIRDIKTSVKEVTGREDKLKGMIEAAPELFEKPRTVTLHGIRLGYQKGKGRIEYDSEDRVIKLIKKHLGDKADMLIAITERLSKKSLDQLTAEELKKIGVRVVDAEDYVLIKAADSAIDKYVNALMADMDKAINREW